MRRPYGSRSTLATLGVLVVLASLPSTATRAADEPSLAPVQESLLVMRNQIRNASVKFQNGIVAAATAGEADTATPARACCGPNLDRVSSRSHDLAEFLDELRTSYVKTSNRPGAEAIGRLHADLDAFDKAWARFDRSPGREDAQGALAAVTRSYLQVVRSADALVACCAPPAERPAAGQPNPSAPAER